MPGLKRKLELIRVEAITGHFVPEKLLSELFTQEEILSELNDSKIPPEYRTELVKFAVGRGRKLFAILVQIQAVKKAFDFMSADLKDINIPLEEAHFQHVDAIDCKSDFQRVQWEYIAPLSNEESSSHKSLRREVILPIVEEKLISEEPTSNQQGEEIARARRARKQLQDFKKEVGILRLLRLSKHANIVQILGSYVQNNIYNLIFPLADTDLESVLMGKWSNQILSQGEDFIDQLRALASALHALHFYRCKEMELDLVGCHHDLKPNNILIFGGRFVLADFGVSRLALVQDGSLTKFKDCIGDFFSPDSLQDLSAQSIGRKSDVWSLGCVIIEVATFIVSGAVGVQDFRFKRKTKVSSNYQNSWFHKDGKLKPEVNSWIKELSEQAEESVKDLIQLTSGMFNAVSQQRPGIEEILRNLNFRSLKALTSKANREFEEFLKYNGDFNLEMEKTIFSEWYSGLGLGSRACQDHELRDDLLTSVGTDFRDNIRNIIKVLKRLLPTADILVAREEALERAYLEIRQSNDILWNALPLQMRKAMQAKWKSRRLMTTNIDDLRALEKSARSEDVMISAFKKRIFLLMERNEGSGDNLRVEQDLVTNRKEFGEHSVGWYKKIHSNSQRSVGSGKPIRVIIEWWSYTGWDVASVDELFGRMNRIASLPSRQNRSESSRFLGCEGYLLEEQSNRFGMISPFPEGTSKNPAMQPARLDEVICNNPDIESTNRPLLEDVFRFAAKLIFCVSEFHSDGWLHKNICGRNIVFFQFDDIESIVNVAEPYLIGFNHSRPNDLGVITLKPSLHSSSDIYQHPEYAESSGERQEFCKVFDYYSLGVVLLEIGLWNTMGSTPFLEELEPLDVFARTDRLLGYAASLGVCMGGIYRDAVFACLQGSSGDENVEDNFHERVVKPISRIVI